MWILILLLSFCSICCLGDQVFLLQSGYQTANRPPWNQWQNCPVNVNSNQGDSVKFELKQLGVVQYYYICNQVRNQRTWLISPYFGLNSAKEIYIKIRYTNTQVCPQNRFCASGLGIYASVLFDPIDGNICQTAVLKIFKGLVESQHQDRPIRTIPQPYKYRDTSNVSPQQTPIPFLIAREWRLANMHLTIEDRGTCSEIEAVSVWYYACPLMNYPDAFFPRTVAPAAMNGSITVTGICSGSSTNLPYGLKTTAECQPNGKWANYVNNCPCNAGRERIFVSCQDCKFNYYKSLPSSGKCERCPNSMITIRKGARECVCLKNSILHISGECITMPVCKLFYLAVKNTSAILQFSRIEEQITRNMSFDLECFNCSLKDINFRRYTVYTANITLDKQLMVTNLKPATSYALRVVPWIHIVDGKQKKTPCETVIFRTLDGVPGPPTKVKTQSKKGNPLVHVSWKPPTLPNGAIRRYLIMFSLKEAFNASAEDLEKDVIVEVDHTVLFYNISTLPVRTVFHVTIRAATVHGTFGPPSVTRNVTVYERDRTTSSVIGSVTGGAVATGLGVFALKFGMMAKDGVSAGKIIAVVDKLKALPKLCMKMRNYKRINRVLCCCGLCAILFCCTKCRKKKDVEGGKDSKSCCRCCGRHKNSNSSEDEVVLHARGQATTAGISGNLNTQDQALDNDNQSRRRKRKKKEKEEKKNKKKKSESKKKKSKKKKSKRKNKSSSSSSSSGDSSTIDSYSSSGYRHRRRRGRYSRQDRYYSGSDYYSSSRRRNSPKYRRRRRRSLDSIRDRYDDRYYDRSFSADEKQRYRVHTDCDDHARVSRRHEYYDERKSLHKQLSSKHKKENTRDLPPAYESIARAAQLMEQRKATKDQVYKKPTLSQQQKQILRNLYKKVKANESGSQDKSIKLTARQKLLILKLRRKIAAKKAGENFFSCDEIENLSDISGEFYDCPDSEASNVYKPKLEIQIEPDQQPNPTDSLQRNLQLQNSSDENQALHDRIKDIIYSKRVMNGYFSQNDQGETSAARIA